MRHRSNFMRLIARCALFGSLFLCILAPIAVSAAFAPAPTGGGGDPPLPPQRPTPPPNGKACASGFLSPGMSTITMHTGHTVDIEFDSGGSGFLINVVRSGPPAVFDQHGKRVDIIVNRDEDTAMTGYVPLFNPFTLQPGRWHYTLGTYIPDGDTVQYTFLVTIPANAPTFNASWVARSYTCG